MDIEINKGTTLKIREDGKGEVSQDKGFEVFQSIILSKEDVERISRYMNINDREN